MLIVKLGGSLYNTPELEIWLNTLAECAKTKSIVIVPGGGPFADQVRHSQALHNLSDSHAHYMAVLAMTQFGLLLSSLEPKCQALHYPNNSNAVPNEGLLIWLPDKNILTVDMLKHSWDTTSDSLALWLANELHAEQLIIIKQADTHRNTSIEELCKLGIIDRGFSDLYRQISVPTRIIHAQDHQRFSEQLNTKPKAGSLLT